MKVFELIGVCLGALLCALPKLIYGATFPPIAITSVLLAFAAVGLAMSHPGARWQTGAGVGFGLIVLIIVQMALDYSRDPTSHNLAPFEIIIGLVIGLPPAIAGVLLGNVVRRNVARPEVGGFALVTLSLVGAVASALATAAEITRLEALALTKVAALNAAQHKFRALHPARGYTCDLNELGEAFSGSIQSNHRSESYRLNNVVYRGGTAAFEGEYRYSLKCDGKPDPQDSFVLTARAQPIGSRPLAVFCVGSDGAIRSIGSGKLYSCFAEGRIVHQDR